MITIETLLRILDLGGTFVFAISGAVAAVNRRLDIFGILVLSFVAGNFGGIMRDVLIGAVTTVFGITLAKGTVQKYNIAAFRSTARSVRVNRAGWS